MKKQKNRRRTVQEMEAPVVDLSVDYSKVDTDPHAVRPMGREYPKSRSQMPEDQLFETSVHLDVMYGPMKAGRPTAMARQDAEDALRALKVPERLWERNPERLSDRLPAEVKSHTDAKCFAKRHLHGGADNDNITIIVFTDKMEDRSVDRGDHH